MFRRLLLEDSIAVFTLVAFVVVATIFLAIAWRALRMPREQVERFAQLPFNSESADTRHDDSRV